ncbi:MAG: class I SAM-dependent methyltransferase [Chloroflexota bacterium]
MNQSLFAYYNSGIEDGRLTRNLCNRLEYETTLHLIDAYTSTLKRILEVGAGTGAYVLPLAEQGHDVVAVDIVPLHITLLQEKASQRNLDNLAAHVADARDLRLFDDASMDVVLCLGPLYHLQAYADRKQCLIEALRVAKPDGVVICAYLNRFLTLALSVKRNPKNANPHYLTTLSTTGLFPVGPDDRFGEAAYCSTPDEMEALVADCGAELLDHVAANGSAKLIEDTFNQMCEEQYVAWREWHWQTWRERSILGYSTHGLVVCR